MVVYTQSRIVKHLLMCEKIYPVNRKKVAVGLSGGVDSAVSALLLKRAGFEVVGVHLYCWPPKSEVEKDGMTREEWIKKNGCRADEDRASALKTALEIGIPFKVLDFSEEYNERVMKYFYREYEEGRTPNPDILCNSEIKFGLFLSWALENGFDYIATGHYARLLENDSDHRPHTFSSDEIFRPAAEFSGTQGANFVTSDKNQALRTLRNPDSKGMAHDFSNHFRLYIPRDKHKDQTYFLWKLTQKELAHVLFPLGDLEKTEVRKAAKEAGLSVADKKDSQGICFVGNVEVREFLARRLQKKTGKVFDRNGNVIGEHEGVWFYTIGERGGWTWLPGAQKKYMKEGKTPIMFVVEKNAKENVLTVAEAMEAGKRNFVVGEINLIDKERFLDCVQSDNLLVRIRHGGELLNAKVVLAGLDLDRPETDSKKMEIVLGKLVRGIASGQSAVFYASGGELVGGGVIK